MVVLELLVFVVKNISHLADQMAVMEAKAETLFLGLIKIKIPLLISKIKEYLLLKTVDLDRVRINQAQLQRTLY